MEQRYERIIAETDRYRITGGLRLPGEGYRSRLSDYLNSSGRAFLPLTDVDIEPLDGGGSAQRVPFLALSMSHVVLAMPADEDSTLA